MNILSFKGQGMDYEPNKFSDIGNYCIRTTFTNLEGKQYYIQLGCAPRRNQKRKITSEWALSINSLLNLEKIEGYEEEKRVMKPNYITQLDYTKKDITQWINENLNCDFDTIEVIALPFYQELKKARSAATETSV